MQRLLEARRYLPKEQELMPLTFPRTKPDQRFVLARAQADTVLADMDELLAAPAIPPEPQAETLHHEPLPDRLVQGTARPRGKRLRTLSFPYLPVDYLPGTRRRTPQESVVFQAPKATEQQGSDDYFFSKAWLEKNVADEMRKPLRRNETPWFHLPGTGFWVKEQVDQFVRNTQEAAEPLTQATISRELAKVKVDALAFEDEYLKQMLNLRFRLGWKTVDGQQRIVCTDYGDTLWESVVDPMERDGAVRDAIAGNKELGVIGLEDKLRDAPEDSIAIAASNKDWSGLVDADGRQITFPESQIYVVKKLKGDGLEAFTLRYKGDINQNEALQRSLGLTVKPERDLRGRIKNLMRNTALITPADAERAAREGRPAVRDFSDVVDLMQQVVGGDPIAYEGKSFDEIRRFLDNPDQFTQQNPVSEQLVGRLQAYLASELSKNQPTILLRRKAEIATAQTILQMNRLYRIQEQEEQGGGGSVIRIADLGTAGVLAKQIMGYLGNINPNAEVNDLGTRPGCAGGGPSRVYSSSLGGPRMGEVRGGAHSIRLEDDMGSLEFKCTKGHKNERPWGQTIQFCTTCGENVGC